MLPVKQLFKTTWIVEILVEYLDKNINFRRFFLNDEEKTKIHKKPNPSGYLLLHASKVNCNAFATTEKEHIYVITRESFIDLRFSYTILLLKMNFPTFDQSLSKAVTLKLYSTLL